MQLKQITDDLVADLDGLTFGPPVTHVYNPLTYARAAWDMYCETYGTGPKEVVLVGMNPGPYGMAQVGVPFGEIAHVRDWLGIEAPKEHIRWVAESIDGGGGGYIDYNDFATAVSGDAAAEEDGYFSSELKLAASKLVDGER